MRFLLTYKGITATFCVLLLSTLLAQAQPPAKDPKPLLYVVGTSHLDSQWNWTVQDTIRQFVPNTFFENFKRFEQYPGYTFNYEGAIHYMWFKEYPGRPGRQLRSSDGNC